MWIDNLQVDDLFSYRKVAVKFDRPLSLFLGLNGSGKSSLAHAIELALRGEVLALSGSGLTLDAMIRSGAEAGSVQAAIAERRGVKPVTIRRRVASRGVKTTVNGKPSTKYTFDFFVASGASDPAAVFKILANATGFFELSHEPAKTAERQKTLLLSLIDQGVPLEAFAQTFDAAVAAVGARAPERPVVSTFDELDALFERATAERKRCSIELDSLGAPDVAAEQDEEPDVATVEQRLAGLREERERLVGVSGESAGRRHELERQRERIAQDLEHATIRQRELGPLAAAEAAVTDARATLQAAEGVAAKRNTLLGEIRAEEERLASVRRQQDALKRLGDACVISEDVVCPLDEANRTRILGQWAVRIDELGRRIADKKRALPEAANLERLRAHVKDAERAVAAITEIAERVSDLDRARVDRETALAALPVVDDAQVTKLGGRIANGEKLLAEARDLIRRREQSRANQARRAEISERCLLLDAVREVCGPKGLKERLLVERLGALTTRVNDVLGHFGFALAFEADPWRVLLALDGQRGVPPVLMAETERLRAGVAFQVALAEMTGTRFALIDGIDALDQRNRGALFGVLDEAVAKGWIEQAILTATYQSEEALGGDYGEAVGVYHIDAASEGSRIVRRR